MSKLDWHSLCSLLISLLCCTTLELPLLHVHGFSRQSVQHRSRLEVFLRHVKAAFSHVLSQLSWEGEECQVASGAKKEHCREAKRPVLQTAFWPVVSAQTSLFKAHRSCWVSFFFSFFLHCGSGWFPHKPAPQTPIHHLQSISSGPRTQMISWSLEQIPS